MNLGPDDQLQTVYLLYNKYLKKEEILTFKHMLPL
jgi:hypothetical protein